MPDLPGPKKAKAFPVPSDHGLGLDDDECGAPAGHTPHSQAQRSRSSGINFGFFTERCRTPSWCRSARFSNWRFTRVLKPDDRATTSVVSISSVRARRLWSLRKPHLLRSFDIYGRHSFARTGVNTPGTMFPKLLVRGDDDLPARPLRPPALCFHQVCEDVIYARQVAFAFGLQPI